MPVAEGHSALWGDTLVSEMKARHLEALQKRLAATPSKPWHLKTMLRKIFKVARREEWVAGDPTELVEWDRGGNKGGYFGHQPWTVEARAKFEARHPIGSQARTAYALALYSGCRRGDVAALTWEQLVTVKDADGNEVEAFVFAQQKVVQSDQDMTQVRPLFDELAEALAPLDRSAGGAVLKTAYGQAFSGKSLTGKMAEWTRQAGIEPGYGLHGLRKNNAAVLGESGATFQEQKDLLGHTTTQQVALYAKSVDKKKTTIAGVKKLAGKFRLG